MVAKVIQANLLEIDTKYIVHQCNCFTWVAAGLAQAVFEKFPYANIYKDRKPVGDENGKIDKPGTIIIKGNGIEQRYIINLLGQYYPGRPKYKDSQKDGFKTRKKYFFSGLKEIAKINDLDSIAFPWQIGCGIAGGNWDEYKELIDKFAIHVKDRAEVFICKPD